MLAYRISYGDLSELFDSAIETRFWDMDFS